LKNATKSEVTDLDNQSEAGDSLSSAKASIKPQAIRKASVMNFAMPNMVEAEEMSPYKSP